MSKEWNATQYKICLFAVPGGFVWAREDGERCSPVFTTRQAAAEMPGKLPFMTHAEWLKKSDPGILP